MQTILLGILQGLTEFLPISSSGHLVLVKSLFDINTGSNISFEVFVHFGTFLSVIIIFKNDILGIMVVLLEAIKNPKNIRKLYIQSEVFRFVVYLLVSCIPAGLIGFLYENEIEILFTDPKLVADMLLITGVILFLTRFAKQSGNGKVTLLSSLGIGVAQAIAIVPGISRAGITISAGLLMNVSQENAARFSFLMALPVIFGATLLKMGHLINSPPPSDQLLSLIGGTVAACISGYLAIRFLLKILSKGKFSLFSYYCFVVGILGILFIE